MAQRYFVMYATDRPGMLERRVEWRETHRAHIRRESVSVKAVLGGPTLDTSGQMNGTMLVFQAESMQAVRDFVASDPYVLGDLFASLDIREWSWGLGTPSDEP